MCVIQRKCTIFFFNDTATTEIYTLSLHDALPIYVRVLAQEGSQDGGERAAHPLVDLDLVDALEVVLDGDRKSTRLNSSHLVISYAVFCLKKKKRMMLSMIYAERAVVYFC